MTVEATGVLTPVSIGQATATDAVKVVSITNNAPSKFPLGVTMVTWTAMNAGGNTAKAVQTITIAIPLLLHLLLHPMLLFRQQVLIIILLI